MRGEGGGGMVVELSSVMMNFETCNNENGVRKFAIARV